ncbi:MAG: hypothetical protein MI757_15715, partial [Pirellulales bacterium]|nr:hypothetical protein [Pirellulales bacterium]
PICRRATPVDSANTDQSQLLRDFIFGPRADDEALRIVVEGLEPNGHYDGTLWSFDSGSGGQRTSKWLVNGRSLAEAYFFDGLQLPTSNADCQLNFKSQASSDGQLFIEVQHVSAPRSPYYSAFINALRLKRMEYEPITPVGVDDEDKVEAAEGTSTARADTDAADVAAATQVEATH